MTDFRYDRSAIILPPKPELTREGFLRAYMRIARTGNLEYRNHDGSKRVERVRPEVLFDEQSMDSFATKPLALLWHPQERVTPDNIQRYGKGLTGDIPVQDGDFLGFGVTITHRDAIESVLSRQLREASCGYGVRLSDRADGDGVYDQLFRDGNHVLICKRGRAGPEVSLQLDSDDQVWWQTDSLDDRYWTPSEVASDFLKDIHPKWFWTLDSCKCQQGKESPVQQSINSPTQASNSRSRKDKRMTYKFTLDSIEFTTEDFDLARQGKEINGELLKLRADSEKLSAKLETANAAIADLKAKLEASESQTRQLQSNLDAAESRYDSLKLDYDDIRNRADSDDSVGSSESVNNDELATIITERMQLWNEVLPFLRSDSPDYEPDYTLEPIAIMTEAVRAANPELQDHLDSLDLSEPEAAGFVKGLFATLNSKQFAQRKNPRRNVDSLLDDIRSQRSDGGMYTDPMMAKTEAKKKRQARIRGNAKAMMGE